MHTDSLILHLILKNWFGILQLTKLYIHSHMSTWDSNKKVIHDAWIESITESQLPCSNLISVKAIKGLCMST